jgi:hypothetical protein
MADVVGFPETRSRFDALWEALGAYPPHPKLLAAFREYLDEVEQRLALLSGDAPRASVAQRPAELVTKPIPARRAAADARSETTVLDLPTYVRGGDDA